MKFKTPLIKATLLKRYKRFLADCVLHSGEIITAHCPNSGRMIGLDMEGLTVWLSPKDGKLKYGMEFVDLGQGNLVGINTMHPNKIVEEALHAKEIEEFSDYSGIRREVKYGTNSRVDFLLTENNLPSVYLEIKNVHLKRADIFEFPDAVTERGAKHMHELSEMVRLGHRAAVLFLVQRTDADEFTVAADIDPEYMRALQYARAYGVEVLAYKCKICLDEIILDKKVAVRF